MTRVRLLPLVVAAALVLLGLKVVEFGFGARRGAEVVAVDPTTGREVDMIATGSSGGQSAEKPKEGEHGAPAAEAGHGGGVTPSKVDTKVSGDKPMEAKPVPGQELLSEIDILQKLAARRKQLDEMERQLQMREDLLRASEGRITKRIEELKGLEDQVGKAATRLEQDTVKSQEITDLVKMYEAMKAKDAARVFDKLDIGLLGEIARQMNPKKLGDVVAKMAPDQAEKLTVELANRRQKEPPRATVPAQTELPKIEGRS